jgi:hypothetical protein
MKIPFKELNVGEFYNLEIVAEHRYPGTPGEYNLEVVTSVDIQEFSGGEYPDITGLAILKAGKEETIRVCFYVATNSGFQNLVKPLTKCITITDARRKFAKLAEVLSNEAR